MGMANGPTINAGELSLTWKKSTRSGTGDEHGGGNCVEVAMTDENQQA